MAGFKTILFHFMLILGFSHCVMLPSDVNQAKKEGIVELVEWKRSKEEPLHREPKSSNSKILDIYCFEGKSGDVWKRLPKLFQTANLHIHINSEEYETFKGNNESVVYQQFVENLRSWMNLVPWQQKEVSMDVFNRTCVGIKTVRPYSVTFLIKRIDFKLVGVLAVGVFLFVMAGVLSRNLLFYYGSGISIGVFASILIVVYIMSRFVPWKKGSYIVLLGGGSVSLWLLQYIYENCFKILETYWEYVLAYILVAGLLSFAVCYWFGPVENPRSLDLIKWTIQLFASILIFISTQIPEASCAFIIVILTIYNLSFCKFPFSMFYGVKKVWIRKIKMTLFRISDYNWRRRFPVSRKLLSEDEYYLQAQEETRKALEDLRKHVRSPDCDAWRTISRLKSPHRFATWVEGDSHVTEDEMSAFEQSLDFDLDGAGDRFTDDDGGEDEIDFRLSSP